ncbi:type II toxin-antitoxin system RelE/ParE family toxin [Bacteroides sp. 519]|uniref:type II toxin-antitoxin system RelE/ParE family toxin n=1 Tax=Bacteroides sp. 519 TaxID=2302937 RepID=UPI0013D02D47|nr:type II toxin-antitoxin system RelE/ParE family toxin [Bacteroides sp. 519]NDV58772.1 type II toxin-antitoxin system RelE/ParE family toxin [Bacteroides sp. 519]
MEIVWTNEAEFQLQTIIDYYLEVASTQVVEKLVAKITNAVTRLSSFPHIGHIEHYLEGLPFKYYSFVAHPNYKIIYRIQNTTIYITGIWDCRQDPYRMASKVGN